MSESGTDTKIQNSPVKSDQTMFQIFQCRYDDLVLSALIQHTHDVVYLQILLIRLTQRWSSIGNTEPVLGFIMQVEGRETRKTHSARPRSNLQHLGLPEQPEFLAKMSTFALGIELSYFILPAHLHEYTMSPRSYFPLELGFPPNLKIANSSSTPGKLNPKFNYVRLRMYLVKLAHKAVQCHFHSAP